MGKAPLWCLPRRGLFCLEAAASGGFPFWFQKGNRKKTRGTARGISSPYRRPPGPPGYVRAAVRFSEVGKTCERLQLVLVWQSNNFGCRPSAYKLERIRSSCVLFGANKLPPVSASLNHLCARWESARAADSRPYKGLVVCKKPLRTRLAGTAMPGAPRQRMGDEQLHVRP